jgi:hypothetical protein
MTPEELATSIVNAIETARRLEPDRPWGLAPKDTQRLEHDLLKVVWGLGDHFEGLEWLEGSTMKIGSTAIPPHALVLAWITSVYLDVATFHGDFHRDHASGRGYRTTVDRKVLLIIRKDCFILAVPRPRSRRDVLREILATETHS